jgi:LPS O-antigen subunit length determinant protein (WzzB/FepE family)
VDTVLVVLIVAVAVAYVARKVWVATKAARKPKDTGCGSDCGCGH